MLLFVISNLNCTVDQLAEQSHEVQVVHLVQEECHKLPRSDVDHLPDVTPSNTVINPGQSPERCHGPLPHPRVQGSHTRDEGELDHNPLETEFIVTFQDARSSCGVLVTAIIAFGAFASTKEE